MTLLSVSNNCCFIENSFTERFSLVFLKIQYSNIKFKYFFERKQKFGLVYNKSVEGNLEIELV